MNDTLVVNNNFSTSLDLLSSDMFTPPISNELFEDEHINDTYHTNQSITPQ